MTGKDDFVPYSPLPSQPNPPNPNVVVVLPAYRPTYRRRNHRCRLYSAALALFLFLAAAVFFLYPSDPAIRVDRLHLNHIQIKTTPKLLLDLSFSLTVKVRNGNFFSLLYDSIDVAVGYRGRELGFVSSDGGLLKARGSSYMNATLNVNGFQVIHDVFYLLEDLAKGVIPFDTDTRVKGELGLLFVSIPLKDILILFICMRTACLVVFMISVDIIDICILFDHLIPSIKNIVCSTQATVSCQVYVNTDNQTILRQDCYPENSSSITVILSRWISENAFVVLLNTILVMFITFEVRLLIWGSESESIFVDLKSSCPSQRELGFSLEFLLVSKFEA
ncbi:Water stress and hypersensitive response domain containing protein [Senna tora]|uniref:Water stress and hypersensitive response domain containing protein n=1 Tax=Senna tora TaxID=362788 RepID=A0A834T187_9FABA|nr:Water stress and hypersensitive response domain containing protein [Senna tora]